MRQRATVVSTDGKTAIIAVRRSSMCAGCEKKDCGGHCDISGLIDTGKTMTARADNRIGAIPGDMVEIETESSRVLGYAALVFLCPLLLCAIVYAVVHGITQRDDISIAAAGGALVVAFLLLAVLDRRHAKETPDIRIVARLNEHT